MQRSELGSLLLILAEQTKEQVSPQRLAYMVSELEAHIGPKLAEAMKQLIREARRFPTIAEIEEAMGVGRATDKDEAMLITEGIVSALIRFGWLQPGYVAGAKARELAVGSAGWTIISRAGGWNSVLDRLGENESALRAQLRDLTGAYLRTGAIERGQLPPAAHLSPYQALEAVKEKEPQLLEEARSAERRNKLTAELESLKKARQLALMQEEHDKDRRLPDPNTEDPPF